MIVKINQRNRSSDAVKESMRAYRRIVSKVRGNYIMGEKGRVKMNS